MKPSKLDVFEHILLDGACWVNFDARVKGVRVPKRYKNRPNVELQFGFYESDDLSFDGHSVSATLSFDGVRFPCYVPWAAVFAIGREDGHGMLWTETMPADALEEPLEQKVERRLRLVHSR